MKERKQICQEKARLVEDNEGLNHRNSCLQTENTRLKNLLAKGRDPPGQMGKGQLLHKRHFPVPLAAPPAKVAKKHGYPKVIKMSIPAYTYFRGINLVLHQKSDGGPLYWNHFKGGSCRLNKGEKHVRVQVVKYPEYENEPYWFVSTVPFETPLDSHVGEEGVLDMYFAAVDPQNPTKIPVHGWQALGCAYNNEMPTFSYR